MSSQAFRRAFHRDVGLGAVGWGLGACTNKTLLNAELKAARDVTVHFDPIKAGL